MIKNAWIKFFLLNDETSRGASSHYYFKSSRWKPSLVYSDIYFHSLQTLLPSESVTLYKICAPSARSSRIFRPSPRSCTRTRLAAEVQVYLLAVELNHLLFWTRHRAILLKAALLSASLVGPTFSLDSQLHHRFF